MLPSKKLAQGLAIWAFAAGLCLAQREPPNSDRLDEQGKILWPISFESNKADKLRHLEKFSADYPKDQNIGWVYDQIYSLAIESNDVPRVLSVSDKLLALDPEDLELAYKNLKLAEGTKDQALIKKWSQISENIGRRTIASPKDTEAGKRRLALAPQVIAYLEYVTYATILQTPDRAKRLELMEQFIKANPRSIYVPAMQRQTFAMWREIDPQKALTIAEKMVEKDPNNEDALIMVAENYVQREKDPDKVLAYAERIVTLMEQTAKMEGMPEAEWSKKRANLTGRANWLVGSIAMQRNNFVLADRSIRAALPYIKGDPRLFSMALFHLGWANYRIGNIADAIRFNQDCTRIKGPYQEQATKNLAVIRSENPSAHP